MPPTCRPLAACPTSSLRDCLGLFTDIDDTLTAGGAIEPAALLALRQLHAAGIPVIAITGRPTAWSRALFNPGPEAWPVRAIVAENGAVALLPDRGTLQLEYAQSEVTRAHNVQRLAAVLARILGEVPGATAARDSAGRLTDIAIDHGEFMSLDARGIERVVAIMRDEGMSATVSSIHVNGWFGDHDKLSGAHWMVQRLYGRVLATEMDRWVYVGDSTNDQAMFAAFALSVGVANLRRFADQVQTWPAFITEGERGIGFAEVAARLLTAKRAPRLPAALR